ncbi:hemicentin-1 isoform X12 [Carassius gibelio]|uniref:hemicentin-1 isoform X12 n=1 Tax=Carassius gibelio TaxID=101364 RepID=UPI002278F34C|nr:hemicentin-1 isoform X12 [Carassius gibelio]
MFQHFIVYLFAVSPLVSLTGAEAECPLQLNPQRVVVRYAGSVEVNCKTSVLHRGMGWEASEGAVPMTKNQNLITWRVINLTEWDIFPICYINLKKGAQCKVELPVTVYQTPDSVSISTVNHRGPMIEGQQYELQCDVHDVAPVQNLTVKWYKGQTLLHQTTFSDTDKTPENKTVTLLIRPDRADDGAQYWCEAELDLGAEGPQPSPKYSSEPLNVEVYYKPQHSSSTETIIKDDKVMLDCSVKANPAPDYTWSSDHLNLNISSSVIKSSALSPGKYMCTATNSLGRDSKVFILKSTGAEAECPLQLNPQRVVVRYGGSVEVNCKTSVLHRGMGWEASEGAVPMTKNQNLITWRVSELTEWDMFPFCYINPNEGAQCEVKLPVTIYKTPDSVSISTVNHRGPMKEGQQYELQCDVHDVAPVQYLTVKWYKGQTLLHQTTFSDTDKTPVNKTVTLLIRPDRADDGAQYRCEAELDLGAEGPQPSPKYSSEPRNVEVYYKPQHSSSTETIIKDDKVMLDCSVKANPAPDYTWSSDHLNLNISSSVIESSALSPGKYTCTATNSLGRDSKVFILKSTGAEAECPLQLNPQRVVVRYGGSVEVNCKTSVLHRGMGWEASEGAVPKIINQNLITWKVINLTEWDIFPICYINLNKGAQCKVELPVTVYKTPDSVSISTVNHRGPMIEGQQYELQCDVHDVAPVQYLTVKWYKGQTLLNQTTFSDTDKTPVNKTVTLLIRPDRADDGAQYWCEAELDLGAEGPQPSPKYSSEPLNVEVYYKPQHSSSTETIIKDDKVMLDCSVKANPAPDYTWSSDHLNLNISSSVIESSALSPGKYTCTATNSLGRDSKVFILKSTGAEAECPLQLNPQRVVVRYGGSVEVNCKTSVLHKGMGWEASEGAVPKIINQNLITWRVSELTEWDMFPFCYINPNEGAQCEVKLPVTIYKTPDSVSISTVNHRGPMIEGQQYELQCDVHDVAPVQYLTVKWYKGQTLLHQTTFSDTDKTPVNKTVTLLIRPDRADDGAQYWCEAELDLGAEGPQPSPKYSSEPLNVEVYYKPQHSSSTETIIKDDKVMLDCSVKANPAPDYTWSSDHLNLNISSSVIESSALSPGKYTCTATNSLGRDSKVFILKSTGAEAECPLQLNPQRVVVRYGGSVEVNCKTSVLHRGMGWEASEGAVPMTKNQNLITWRVINLTEWDIFPICYINLNKGAQCKVELPVTVYKTPDSVSISTVNHRGPMIEGQQYELQCDVHDVAPVQYLTVKWYKGQTLLNQTTFSDTDKTPVNKTVTLLIRPDRDDDGAQYRCEAELDLGAEGPQPSPKYSSEPLNVEVYYKPQHSSSTETIIKDDKVMLDCSVKANPAPDYTWSSDHLNLNISSSVIESSALSPGKYTCTATNSLGRDSKVFILKSTGAEAECPLQLNPQRVVVRYGGSVEVNCKTSVLHKGMGWEASEGAVPKIINQNLITWRVSELTEWDIFPFCYINLNKGAQCEVKLPVTVYKTPDSVSISTVNHTKPMIEGQQYELQCDVHDVAPVEYLTVKWYKNQTLINETTFSDTDKTPVNKTVTLLIRPNGNDNRAQYRCEAELDLGAEGPQPSPKYSSKSLNVEVYYKPRHSSSTETIIKDVKGVLNCTVKANPAPDYTWSSDHLNLNISSSVIKSSALSPGKYTCTASNILGRDSKVFILKSTGIRPTFWTVLTVFQLSVALISVI